MPRSRQTGQDKGSGATPPAWDFNPDPAWQLYVQEFEGVIESIAAKYCLDDLFMRADTKQEARIALATLRPSKVRGFAEFVAGTLTQTKWRGRLDRYCRNVIRNSILSYLDPYGTGNWYIGRSRPVRDKVTGVTRRVRVGPRYVSFDKLHDEDGFDVSSAGEAQFYRRGDERRADPNDGGPLG